MEHDYENFSQERRLLMMYRDIHMMHYPEYDKVSIAQAWRNAGWSFLQHLASALFSADPENEKKIRNTFDNYIKEYEEDIYILENNAWTDQ